MQNSRKNSLFPNRLIFQQQGGLSKKPGDTKKDEILKNVTSKIEKSVGGQLGMRVEAEEKVSPINAEREKQSKIIKLMNEERVEGANAPTPRSFESFGKTVIVEMDSDGTYHETVDGQEINFLLWALEQNKKSDGTNNS